ncbi:organic solvent tolerance protein [Candidatus Pelagibacter sp.]|nr:organic solvent tolerance protein [Candidatus Pelagibacter sp.]
MFDVTEIEITEKGNKFKGLKKGVIKTDNGVIINSNTFSYIKNKNELNASGNVILNDKNKGIIIYSDNIFYLKNKEIILSKKNSRALYGDIDITADEFIYKKKLNTLSAIGNVKIIDKVKNIIIYSNDITYLKNEEKIFTKGKTNIVVNSKYDVNSSDVIFLRNEEKLSSNFKTKIINQKKKSYDLDEFIFLTGKELLKGININITSNIEVEKSKSDHAKFKSGFFDLKNEEYVASETQVKLSKDVFDNPENDPRLIGISSSQKNGNTIVRKGLFTSCKQVNGKCPPWSIKADKITHNKDKRQLLYDNAFLRVYDIPVLYFPKFFHPDPSVKRQSGFLKPQLNKSDILGSSIYMPYYNVISDSKDNTFKPTLFDSDIYMIQNEYRQKNKNSSFVLDAGLTTGYQSSLSKNKNTISHIFSKFDMDLKLAEFSNSDLNIFVEKVSNDTYLKIFDNNLMDTDLKPLNFNSLKSGLILNLNHTDYNLETGMTVYENLQESNNSDRYQFVLPYYNFSKNLDIGENLMGSIDFSSSGSNLLQNTNNLKSTIGNTLSYESFDIISSQGLKNNFNFYLHNSNTVAKNDTIHKSSPQMELNSIFEFASSFPLMKTNTEYFQTIEPKISLRVNPSDMNNYSSTQRTITTGNIFNIDRLGLGNVYESGKSITLGVNYRKEKIEDINKYFEMKAATVIRDVGEDRIPTSSTINRKNSNLFGTINYNMSESLSLSYNIALDNDFETIEYNSLGTTISVENLITEFNFIEENGEIGTTNSFDIKAEYSFDENNYLSFKTRRNRNINLTEYYDLIYEYKNDCLTAGMKYKKTYYEDRDLKPKEDLLFTITFFPLSTFEQEIDQNLYRN